MLAELIDNPTRKTITLTLKKRGSLSVDDLSKELSITPMGVRQHLLVLERNGVVEHVTKKQGVGRPGFLYKLTEGADDLFPKAYSEFALDILRDIEENEGRGKINELFRRRKDRILSERRKLFEGKSRLSDRIAALKTMLREKGSLFEIEEEVTHYKLRQYNCPLLKIASNFSEACTYELELFRELIGKDVEILHRISEGSRACEFLIHKRNGRQT